MIFFIDENISDRLAKMLAIFDRENQIRAHADYFKKGTPDTEWIREVASWDQKPVIVCGDGRILTNKAEKAVLKEGNLTFVLLAQSWVRLQWEEQAWKFIKAWPDIVKNVTIARFPMIFEVSINMKVSTIGRTSTL